MLNQLKKDLTSLASKEKAEFLPKFFKSGPGGYAEGDKFIGVTVPNCRYISKKYQDLPSRQTQKLLTSPIHEERLVALLILVGKFNREGAETKKDVYDFYLKNTKYINNWDLVDLTADKIVGEYLYNKPKKILKKLANSALLWERRIAIISTFNFIKRGEYKYSLEVAQALLDDKHDLIHKAVGWMLREIGKRSPNELENFLKTYYQKIPRTSLRYAIERFPKKKRLRYLKGLF